MLSKWSCLSIVTAILVPILCSGCGQGLSTTPQFSLVPRPVQMGLGTRLASIEPIHITALKEVAHSLITQPTGLTLLQQLVPQRHPAPLQPETQPQESHLSRQPWPGEDRYISSIRTCYTRTIQDSSADYVTKKLGRILGTRLPTQDTTYSSRIDGSQWVLIFN